MYILSITKRRLYFKSSSITLLQLFTDYTMLVICPSTTVIVLPSTVVKLPLIAFLVTQLLRASLTEVPETEESFANAEA